MIIIAVGIWDFYIILTFPYRHLSTNIVNVVLWVGLTPNLLLLYLRTTEIRSALIIRDTDFIGLLIAYNMFIILSMAMLSLLMAVLKVHW